MLVLSTTKTFAKFRISCYHELMINSTQDNLFYRKKYAEFVFESYDVKFEPNALTVTYTYTLGEHTFTPTVHIPTADISNNEIDEGFLDYLFFNFGIINAINYYKLSIAPKFVIKAGYLDDNQKNFFKKLFYHGLGEFLYVNNLPFDLSNLMEIETVAKDSEVDAPSAYELGEGYAGNLIPVGGGKDSVVTLEALRSMHDNNLCLQYNRNIYPTNRAALDCIKNAGYGADKIADFDLTLDPHMLELNQSGYYNGHIPFSSCLAFAAYIMAYLNKKAYIVLSNEASANEGNISGMGINHQYSKSFEFETDFRNYTKRYFTDKIQYFSLLRCLNEYQIVQRFLHYPIYLYLFRSCNVGTHENKWCSHCAKCLYVFIMLYPFITLEKLNKIFGHDLLDDQTLFNTFVGLINPDKTKPFECVGTREEINYCLTLAVIEAEQDSSVQLPALLQWYKANFYNPNIAYNVKNYYNPQHYIPEQYLPLIMNA